MGIVKIIWWNILSIVLARARGAVVLEDIKNSSSSSKYLDVFPGFRLTVEDDELRIKLNMEDIFPVTAVQSRSGDGDGSHKDDNKKNPSKMQKFGSIMMMIPLVMQMMSFPAAIASLKMSLMRTIFVAKFAIIIMIYNLVKSQQQPTKTVVIHTPAAHHDHYYSHMHEEEDDHGWFG